MAIQFKVPGKAASTRYLTKPPGVSAYEKELASVLSRILDQSTVIGGDTSGAVTSGDTVNDTSSGTLTIADSDTSESHFNAQINTIGLYGTFTINDAGLWTYTLDNTNTDVLLALGAGEILMETFTVTSLDGLATATVTITITIGTSI